MKFIVKKTYQYICYGLFILVCFLSFIIKINLSFTFLLLLYFIVVFSLLLYINFLRNIKCPKCGVINKIYKQKKDKLICKECKNEIDVETIELENYS